MDDRLVVMLNLLIRNRFVVQYSDLDVRLRIMLCMVPMVLDVEIKQLLLPLFSELIECFVTHVIILVRLLHAELWSYHRHVNSHVCHNLIESNLCSFLD